MRYLSECQDYALDSLQEIRPVTVNGLELLTPVKSTGSAVTVRRAGPFGKIPSPPSMELPISMIELMS